MLTYADIAFPTAVRQPFTYQLPQKLKERAQPGKRVWVPLRKQKAVGMIVNIHHHQPDFNTRTVEQILDKEPILSDEMLQLTRWMHRFYYSSWGEVIQAALPRGLNFSAEEHLKPGMEELPTHLDDQELEIAKQIEQKGSYLLKEAEKRWGADVIDNLVGQKVLQVWEKPIRDMSPNTEKLWRWSQDSSPAAARDLISEYKEDGNLYKWVQALEVLTESDLPEFQKDLTAHSLLEHYTLQRITKEGLIESQKVERNNLSIRYDYNPDTLHDLNSQQQEAFSEVTAALDQDKFASFLLYGVTGSGKTEVYIHALKRALKQGKGGLVLVPEISLTPQIVERFYKVFGDDIAVLHSRLTNRERYDAWRALQQGEKRIAIGARSAVFAPVQNLGIIIIDEEHDASYKQEDPAPRYHGRDVAIMRAHINDAVTVMGSATPSLVSLHGTRNGKSKLLTLTERPQDSTMPQVQVLDLTQYRSAMQGPIAVPLYEATKQALAKEQQAIFLYNRRGFSSYLQCEHCGEIPECPNCSVSLTFHKSKKQLRCHYCGYSERQPSRCGECGHNSIVAQGSGTQQLEEQISELFPEAETLRMDYDTTSGKDGHANILNAFGRKEADILVGTQIVGKGLDFPEVTVVGVIDADTELAFPSFRSGERMYQLLSQVAGRSGRAGKEGKVYFQTWKPDHPAVQMAKDHDYHAFAKQELAQRKQLQYPPYSRIIRFVFKGQKERRVQQVAQAFTESIVKVLGQRGPVLGPSPPAIAKMQNYYRWETFIKIKPKNGAHAIEKLIDNVFEDYQKQKPKGGSTVRINVNVDALE